MSGTIGVGTPATTTARGIGRVATSADLVDGATINNGPAFLSAGDVWGLAKNDLSNLSSTAEEVIRSKMTLRNLGTRSTTGDWTLTDVKIGRPLWIAFVPSNNDAACCVTARVTSGATIGSAVYSNMFHLGRLADWGSTNNLLVKPTSTTVVLNIAEIHGVGTIYAEQI